MVSLAADGQVWPLLADVLCPAMVENHLFVTRHVKHSRERGIFFLIRGKVPSKGGEFG